MATTSNGTARCSETRLTIGVSAAEPSTSYCFDPQYTSSHHAVKSED